MLFHKSTQPLVHTEADKTDDGRNDWRLDDGQSVRSQPGHVSASQSPPVLTNTVRALTNRGSASQESLFQAMLADVLLITSAVLIGGLIMVTIIYFS